MNKVSIPAVICLIFLVCSAHAAEIEADSVVTAVTVYPRTALVTRGSSLSVEKGEHTVVFPDIIPDVDENSIRASVSDASSVKLFGAKVKKEFVEEPPSARIKEITGEIERLGDESADLGKRKADLAEEREFLSSVRLFSQDQFSKDIVTKVPQAAELQGILQFLDNEFKNNSAQSAECDLRIREIGRRIDALRNELGQITSGVKRVKRTIVVDLEAVKPAEVKLDVTYLVNDANWESVYDARASFEEGNIELISYGVIVQRTGEDWTDVDITLSTAKPVIGGTMPEVMPWFIRPYQPRPVYYKEKSVMSKMDSLVPMTGGKDEESFPMEADVPIYATPEDKGVAVVYKLPRKTGITADGAENKLPVSSQMLSGKFEYHTYPRESTYAYLASRVTNAKDLQLLAGRVSIFLEGDFIGYSAIKNIAPGEEFDLYLGADENVKVKRELIAKKADETLIGNIPSPTRKTIFEYKLEVENHKQKAVKVNLFESMPVPEDDRIKVKIDKVSGEPKEKDWKDKKGVWRWELELEPNKKQEILYTFTVEHPRDMEIEGL